MSDLSGEIGHRINLSGLTGFKTTLQGSMRELTLLGRKGRAVQKQLGVGDSAFGGIVAHIFVDGETGYVAGENHGFVVSIHEIASPTIIWGNTAVSVSTSTAVGEGGQNTANILAGDATRPIAASLSVAYTNEDEEDWVLPSRNELTKIYNNKSTIGLTFQNASYWSSSEAFGDMAWSRNLSTGNEAAFLKNATNRVRAIKYF